MLEHLVRSIVTPAPAADVDLPGLGTTTLAQRLTDEARSASAVSIGPGLVSVWARTPEAIAC